MQSKTLRKIIAFIYAILIIAGVCIGFQYSNDSSNEYRERLRFINDAWTVDGNSIEFPYGQSEQTFTMHSTLPDVKSNEFLIIRAYYDTYAAYIDGQIISQSSDNTFLATGYYSIVDVLRKRKTYTNLLVSYVNLAFIILALLSLVFYINNSLFRYIDVLVFDIYLYVIAQVFLIYKRISIAIKDQQEHAITKFYAYNEFAVSLSANKEQLDKAIKSFKAKLVDYKGEYVNGLSASVGYARSDEYPDASFEELQAKADEAMYADKNAYYEANGINRRK